MPSSPIAYSKSAAGQLGYYGAAAYFGESDKQEDYDEAEGGVPARSAVEFIPDRPALYVDQKKGSCISVVFSPGIIFFMKTNNLFSKPRSY